MLTKDIYETLDAVKKHKKYKEMPKNAFLGFIYFSDDEFQLGFFLPDEKKYRVFYIKPGKKDGDFLVNDESHEKQPQPLDIERVVITLNDVIHIANQIFIENYPYEKQYKTFYILENTDLGIIWNVIILTNQMKLVKLKICSETGHLISAKEEKVWDYKV